jgi:hypothetical protein
VDCCVDLVRAVDAQVIVRMNKHELTDGRILNRIESEYYLKIPRRDESFNYYALNFCPFCGLALSARAQGFI